MSHFLQLFAENSTKTAKHDSLLEKLLVLAKSMIFRAFSRNEPLFATFCSIVDQNAETRKFARKVASFGQIDDFSCLFTKSATFCWLVDQNAETRKFAGRVVSFCQIAYFSCFFAKWAPFLQLFAEKWTKTPKHGSFLGKIQVLAKSMTFRAFSRNDPFLAKKLTKTPKHGSLLQKLQVLAKSMIFRAFSRNEPFFDTFCWKVDQNAETWQFARKVASFGKIDDFSSFFTKWASVCNFLVKSLEERGNMVVCSESVKFWPNRWVFVPFHEMSHFLSLFAQ